MSWNTGRPGWPSAERAGFIAAIASVGPTLAPSNLPRSVTDQAIATGAVTATNYAIVTTGQNLLYAAARLLVRGVGREAVPTVEILADLAGVAAGAAAVRWAPRTPQPDTARSLGARLVRSCTVGLVATGTADLGRRWEQRTPAWALPSGRPMAALLGGIAAARSAHRSLAGAHDTPVQHLAKSLAMGGGISLALVGVGAVEHRVARGIARVVGPVFPPGPTGAALAEAVGRAAMLMLTAIALRAWIHRGELASQHQNAHLEPANAEPPAIAGVTGGPDSTVRYDTVGLEGGRFIHAVATPAEIDDVMGGHRAEPVRAYVGYDSAATADERVALALRELEGLGAFDRGTLCVAVPAGTGFVNAVAVGALEYLTRGDCATVAIAYSQRRSYYSLDKVRLGADQTGRLLHGIDARIATRPEGRRPTLVLYAESLGALAAQDSFAVPGADALHEAGVRYALFAGTPSAATWARTWRTKERAGAADAEPSVSRVVEVASHEEWLALAPERRDNTRAVLLTHHDDPVPVFDRWLALRPPRSRLDTTTGTGSTPFRPLTTFVLTALDLKNAMGSGGSRFTAIGHDYTADLTQFVANAYHLPHDPGTLTRIEAALQARRDEAMGQQPAGAWT